MGLVYCVIEEVEIDNENGWPVESVTATCTKCHNVTESFGTHEDSIRRCLALMREECPTKEGAFYKAKMSDYGDPPL